VFNWENDALIDVKSDLLITSSMDKTLAAIDIVSGKILWKQELVSAPLCMDITSDGTPLMNLPTTLSSFLRF
jgi:PQQ enzyme repeat